MLAAASGAREVGGSFRDPGGRLFWMGPSLYRHVREPCRPDYDCFVRSGLYEALAGAGLLVRHREVPDPLGSGTLTLEPERVAFVSYPYEWTFAQLQAAALATLAIQKEAFARGMVLKDASAYNVQFAGHRPYLIDTLSFQRYQEGRPWVGYRQFCQHFLAPLALAAHRDHRLDRLLRFYLDGIPLDLAAQMLPWRTRLSLGLGIHVHLHARSQRRHAAARAPPARAMRPLELKALIDSLEQAVRGLRWRARPTEWGAYDDAASYPEGARASKLRLVEALIQAVPGPLRQVWDLGANTGQYSRLAAGTGAYVVALEADESAADQHYRRVAEEKDERVLPLWVDLANPSPSTGWAHEERDSLAQRGPADLVLALALVHHLAIGNNTPLERIARYLASLGRWAVVEFVPKDDPQVQRMLASREDVFSDYTQEGFERAFGGHFRTERAVSIEGSSRRLYLMRRDD
jgi:ribosomal protein L11 methylase PrmA